MALPSAQLGMLVAAPVKFAVGTTAREKLEVLLAVVPANGDGARTQLTWCARAAPANGSGSAAARAQLATLASFPAGGSGSAAEHEQLGTLESVPDEGSSSATARAQLETLAAVPAKGEAGAIARAQLEALSVTFDMIIDAFHFANHTGYWCQDQAMPNTHAQHGAAAGGGRVGNVA
jgi:hypothetical protein